MKKENIALGIFLAFIVGAGIHFYSLQNAPQNVVDINPVVVHRVAQKVSVNNSPATTTAELSGKIDEHLTINNELRDVNFCGKTYKVKQVLIDGVDVVQRVAELATKNLIPASFVKGPYAKEGKPLVLGEGKMAKEICGNINLSPGETIEVKLMEKFNGSQRGLQTEKVYPVSIDEQLFYATTPSTNLYVDDGFSGTFIGPIGELK